MNYLLVGPQEYLKEKFLGELKKKLFLNLNSNQLDYETFQADQSEITDIFNSANTLAFTSKHRIIVIRDIDKFTSEEKELILKYLKSPSSFSTLVLESQSQNTNKFLEDISRLTRVVRCKTLGNGDINLWIKKEFQASGKKISPQSVDTLRELVGNDLYALKNDIDKLVAFVGGAGEVTEKHIEALIGESRYRTAFELLDLVLKKKINSGLSYVSGLLETEKPHRILSLLAWQFRNFIKVKTSGDKMSLKDASRILNSNPAIAKKTLEASRNFTENAIKRKLEIILEGDFSIKTGKMDTRHVLERVFVELCR